MRLFRVILFVCLTSLGFTQTATISGTIADPSTLGQANSTTLNFELKGCAGNQPRVNGTALIWPVVKSYSTDASGVVSGTIDRNDFVTCGQDTTSNFWRETVTQNGITGPPCDVRIVTGAFNANQPTCMNTTTVAPLTAPTDTIYARLDATNTPFTGNLTAKSIESVRYADFFATVQLAINDACNGTNPGKVILQMGAVTGISASITVPSNCTVEGYGGKRSTLKINASLNAPLILLSGVSNVTLRGFGVDGNRSNNSNQIDTIKITNSSHIRLDDMLSTNAIESALNIVGGNTDILVTNSEFSNSGNALPSSVGGGVGIDPKTTTCNSHIRFVNAYIHGNNVGWFLGNSTSPSCVTDDISISGSTVTGNADDGINVNAYQLAGGPITNFRSADNHSGCNGWPANGTGFSASCTAELLQAGSSSSSSGAGIDIIGANNLVRNPTVTGNSTRNNFFDGISAASAPSCTVNTATLAVTAPVACFDTKWKANQPVLIGSTTYLIASVASTTSLTLATTAGTQTGVAFTGPSRFNGTFTGNTSSGNGNAASAIGTGFFNYFADGNAWNGNIGTGNNLEGMGIIGSSFVTVNGGRMEANGTNGAVNTAGYQIGAGFDNQLIGVCADDLGASPTQIRGVTIDSNSNGNKVVSNCLFGSTAALDDTGFGTNYDSGRAPTVLGTIALSARAVNIGPTTAYAVPTNAGGMYRVSTYIIVTQAGSVSSTMPSVTIAYTDRDNNTAQSFVATNTNAGNVLTTQAAAVNYVSAKGGTNISYSTGSYASSGATPMQYALRIVVEPLGN